jgi:hypothetical protein
MTAEECRQLYGRRRVPRRHHKVMVALLAAYVPGHPGEHGLPQREVARLARVSSADPELTRMEAWGIAESWWLDGPQPRQRVYKLTGKGVAVVTALLGLPARPPESAGIPGPGLDPPRGRDERPS